MNIQRPDKPSQEMIDRLAKEPFLGQEFAPAEMREKFDMLYAEVGPRPVDVGQVIERSITSGPTSIDIRIYQPATASGEAVPAMLFLHGGGMIVGSLNSYDGLCRQLCAASDVIVVSASYRLAPEHRFPCAIEDAYTALEWTAESASTFGADPTRIAVGGESGGGNLAAVLTHLVRDRQGPRIRFQLLLYPAVGSLRQSHSMRAFASGYGFDAEALEWIESQYLYDLKSLDSELVSPIHSSDYSSLPDALIVTAEFDILRDDAELYGALLRHAGAAVEIQRYKGTIHGFMMMAGVIDSGQRAILSCGKALRRALIDDGGQSDGD